METLFVSIILIWSLLTLVVAIFIRFNENKLFNIGESLKTLKLFYLISILKERIKHIGYDNPSTNKISLMSTYNLRMLLSVIPVFKDLNISSKNKFTRAYIYDFDNLVSKKNYLVHSDIPVEDEISKAQTILIKNRGKYE